MENASSVPSRSASTGPAIRQIVEMRRILAEAASELAMASPAPVSPSFVPFSSSCCVLDFRN